MSNLKDFGIRELSIAGRLLSSLNTDKDKTEIFDTLNVKSLEMNKHSGYVYLVDTDYNVAVMLGDFLEDFLVCPDCGNEGVRSEFVGLYSDNSCCMEML